MKKILLLFTQYSVDAGQSYPDSLCQALAAAAHGQVQYEHALYDDLQYYLTPDDTHINLPDGRPLESFDMIYQRRWSTMPAHAVAVAIYLQQKGVPCIDAESKHDGSTNKLVQYWRMWEHNLPFPRSVYVSPGRLAGWLEAHLADEFAMPCIMKSVASQRGQNNYLVETVDQAVQIVKDNPTVPFIIQEFIPNDGDYRVLVCGDEIGLIVRRTGSSESHKNNTSLGATADIVPVDVLSPEIRTACIRAAQVFGRNVAGVDVVLHKGDPSKFYFFEVNRSPQIDHSSFTAEKAAVINGYFTQILDDAALASKDLTLIGRAEKISFAELKLRDVPARIDTGARTSAIWVSSAHEENGVLQVVFFGNGSPFYSGKPVPFREYGKVVVASSTGEAQERYKIRLQVKLGGRTIRAWFTLADRSAQAYPILVGRNVLRGKFIVDVKRGTIALQAERQRSGALWAAIEQPRNKEQS